MSLLSETEFGLSILKQTPVDTSYVISPLSISLAMALLHTGANGSTKEELRRAIAKDSSDEQLVDHYRSLSEALKQESDVIVRIANRMFIREGFEVKKSYLDELAKEYAAKAEILDFTNEKACCETVNGFVDEATVGKIKAIVIEEDFRDLKSLLVNAVYFDAEWSTVFDVESTHEEKFYVKKGVSKTIPFMHHWGVRHAHYASTREVEVLTLDYKDEDYKFSILLPKKRIFNKFRLSAFRAKLTAKKLQDLLNSVGQSYLNISIPKFKIEEETNLTEILKNMGITEIFDSNGKLDGIADGLHVSQVKHKAFIEVDESGTKAAAVTYDPLLMSFFGMPDPGNFKANRPFLYVLSYKNHVIFTGQFCG